MTNIGTELRERTLGVRYQVSGLSKQREHDELIAAGSTNELDYQLLLAHDLGYLPSDDHRHLASQAAELRRMLYRFIESLRRSDT